MREVIQTSRSVTERMIAAREGARRPGDPPHLVADAGRARSELGWKPSYDELSQIVETAWNWLLQQQPELRSRDT